MRLAEALSYSFDQVRQRAERTLDGLDDGALAWRPDAGANSIGWLVWHLARVEDGHVAEIAGREQVWLEEAWAQQLGLPADYTDTG